MIVASERTIMAREPKTLFELMLQRVGYKKTRKIMDFIACWGIVEADLGREPSIEEYAVWWKESAATAYREKALFREVFPDEDSPSRIISVGRQRINSRVRGAKARFGPANVWAQLQPRDLAR
jgi:hypothetical protein